MADHAVTEEGATAPVVTAEPAHAPPPPPHQGAGAAAGPAATIGTPRRGRWPILAGVAVAAAALFAWKGVPWIEAGLAHISTDDAFVAGDMTTVTSKVMAEVKEVLVKENDYVEKGTVLVRLDRDLARVMAEQKRAELGRARYTIDQLVGALEAAQVDVIQSRNQVRAGLAALHEAYRAVQGQQDQVRYRVASLRAEAASLRAAQADLALAGKDFDRIRHLVAQGSATQEELDQRHAALQGSTEKEKAAVQKVQQARAMLALGPDYESPERVPADLERTSTDVRRALAAAQRALAGLGLPFHLLGTDPEGLRRTLADLDGKATEAWIDTYPEVRASKARHRQAFAALGGASFDPGRPYDHPAVKFAERELEELDLRLGYTEIRAPVSGFVGKKSVNPGDYVQMGQGLLTIQPLDGVYVVANFKETQLAGLTIGQPVEIEVDAYPGRPVRGRVAGFAPATGAASSLLPPENATGNFVKVVQRVPVRIELAEPNPRETPLLVGLSVIPSVNIKARPTGPDAGDRLRGRPSAGLALKEDRP